jgi:hypothetical protein
VPPNLQSIFYRIVLEVDWQNLKSGGSDVTEVTSVTYGCQQKNIIKKLLSPMLIHITTLFRAQIEIT